MGSVSWKKEVVGSVNEVLDRVTEALKAQGFGILTRIDFHQKMKEKLGKELPPLIILGACNPGFAYEAYQLNPEVTTLLPCNVVVREVAAGKISVEVADPQQLLQILGDARLNRAASTVALALRKALDTL